MTQAFPKPLVDAATALRHATEIHEEMRRYLQINNDDIAIIESAIALKRYVHAKLAFDKEIETYMASCRSEA